MAERRCAACGGRFEPRRNVPQQRYCSHPECQRTRRQRWAREKLAADADYRANQAAAQRRWSAGHPEYWRRYRERHPDYSERNRAQQRERNRQRRGGARGGAEVPAIAKRDEWVPEQGLVSGTYRLIPVTGTGAGIAKRDEYLVKMQVMAAP